MKLSSKFMRAQVAMIKSVSNGFSLERRRKWQDRLGDFMALKYKDSVRTSFFSIGEIDACEIFPKDETSDNVILYLHGGGYTCGGMAYTKAFASVLSARFGCKVYAPDYRLAPENVFPCALDDALAAYEYLLESGYDSTRIILCGESAGGGLCYALCLKIKERALPMPSCVVAISPWTDLTMSGDSYHKNARRDPSIGIKDLRYYANCYMYGTRDAKGTPSTASDKKKDADIKRNPLASPLFADLDGMPPSLIVVGGHEIMLDDSTKMHEMLLSHGVRSKIFVAPKMWHAFPLYPIREAKIAFEEIEKFLSVVAPARKKLRWMALDNSAKIYPAARRRNWTNVFRLSATLDEDVDKEALSSALDITVRRFPSIAVRVKTGVFWYYLEEVPKAPDIMEEQPYPLSRMLFDDIRKCAFRVIVYKKRIALEFFHALTDGNGGLVFLKTLLAEYVKIKHRVDVPSENGILNTLEEPRSEELEDSFLKIDSPVHAPRKDSVAYKLYGTPEKDGYKTNTTFIFDSDELYLKAKSHGVTVTAYVSALLAKACLDVQKIQVKNPKRRKPVKLIVPVNLRPIYKSETLRNFVYFVYPGVDPRLGEYTVDELCQIFSQQMKLQITEKHLSSRISTNVQSERSMILKLAPLFLKNIVMKLIFNAVGDRTGCFTMSNLGVIKLPEALENHIKRMDFVLGAQTYGAYNVGLITYAGKANLNVIRNIREPILERAFYEVIKGEELHTIIEGNQR
ncbi:MAG: steryl acetyl hydrolase [Ruminococcaceae bacterium]|nr:steryl acetyl hydrolase [Oscillospiraceae bacterium]